MHRADLGVFDAALYFKGRSLEIVPRAAAEPLRGQLAQDARADVLDEPDLQRVALAAVFAREQEFQRLGHVGERRQLAQRAEAPFIIGHVPAVEQEHGLRRVPHELPERQHRRARLAVAEAARIVVLPALRHADHARGELFLAHVLGHAVRDRLPDRGKLPELVAPDLAVHGLGQRPGGQAHPLLPALRRAGRAGIAAVKIADALHAHAAAAERAALARPLRAERTVSSRQRHADLQVVLVGQPQAEALLEVVVARERVVIAEALRAAAREPHGDAPLIVREAAAYHRLPALGIEAPGLVKSSHGSSLSFLPAPSRREKSPAGRRPARTSRP